MNIVHSTLDHTIKRLLDKVKNAPAAQNLDLDLITRAVDLGKKAHKGQRRISGECFYNHPIRVAIKAVEHDLDTTAVIGALLHDVVEDTEITYKSVENNFGSTVANLVEALTKVRGNKNLTLKKILLLANKDFRVIVIKLLDRLDNLSDITALKRKKQRLICEETISIYVEVAHGLGLIEIENELKKNVFRVNYFRAYSFFLNKIEQLKQERSVGIDKIVSMVKKALSSVTCLSVTPHYVSPEDFIADRPSMFNVLKSIVIETDTPMNCYVILGLLHTNFRSIPFCIRDFISNPKANGWRGMETNLLVNGEQVPIFLITKEYKEKNDNGVLTLIKEGVYRDAEYRSFLDLYLNMTSDTVRVEDIFRMRKTKSIQVLTPEGDLVELRYGSTITDFAYMVHTDLGLKCAGGIIDNVRYTGSKILEDGMIIKVITDKSVTPNEKWLKFLVMPKAIKETLKYLKKS